MSRDRTRSHYAAHADGQSLAERASGPLYALKRYHNAVKLDLLRQYAPRGGRLLDVGCGRGGDIRKWSHLRRVVAVDVCAEEIVEARRRLAAAPPRGAVVDFRVADFATDYRAEVEPFDAASCMFALHYFFESEATLHACLRNVASSLRPGGVFVGCMPDGDAVLRAVAEGAPTPYLRLAPAWGAGPPPAFGAAYEFALLDTVTAGVDGRTTGSLEYLARWDVLCAAARAHGLEPLARGPFAPPEPFAGHEASRLFTWFVFTSSR